MKRLMLFVVLLGLVSGDCVAANDQSGQPWQRFTYAGAVPTDSYKLAGAQLFIQALAVNQTITQNNPKLAKQAQLFGGDRILTIGTVDAATGTTTNPVANRLLQLMQQYPNSTPVVSFLSFLWGILGGTSSGSGTVTNGDETEACPAGSSASNTCTAAEYHKLGGCVSAGCKCKDGYYVDSVRTQGWQTEYRCIQACSGIEESTFAVESSCNYDYYGDCVAPYCKCTGDTHPDGTSKCTAGGKGAHVVRASSCNNAGIENGKLGGCIDVGYRCEDDYIVDYDEDKHMHFCGDPCGDVIGSTVIDTTCNDNKVHPGKNGCVKMYCKCRGYADAWGNCDYDLDTVSDYNYNTPTQGYQVATGGSGECYGLDEPDSTWLGKPGGCRGSGWRCYEDEIVSGGADCYRVGQCEAEANSDISCFTGKNQISIGPAKVVNPGPNGKWSCDDPVELADCYKSKDANGEGTGDNYCIVLGGYGCYNPCGLAGVYENAVATEVGTCDAGYTGKDSCVAQQCECKYGYVPFKGERQNGKPYYACVDPETTVNCKEIGWTVQDDDCLTHDTNDVQNGCVAKGCRCTGGTNPFVGPTGGGTAIIRECMFTVFGCGVGTYTTGGCTENGKDYYYDIPGGCLDGRFHCYHITSGNKDDGYTADPVKCGSGQGEDDTTGCSGTRNAAHCPCEQLNEDDPGYCDVVNVTNYCACKYGYVAVDKDGKKVTNDEAGVCCCKEGTEGTANCKCQ